MFIVISIICYKERSIICYKFVINIYFLSLKYYIKLTFFFKSFFIFLYLLIFLEKEENISVKYHSTSNVY